MTRSLHLLLTFVFAIFSYSAFTYPLYISIDNPHAHPLSITSAAEKLTVEIPAKNSREFIVCGESDYVVQYQSGARGVLGEWKLVELNLNRKLDDFIDKCKKNLGARWDEQVVKYCAFKLDLDVRETGLVSNIYTLEVTQILNLKIPFGAPQCQLSERERALKVVPISKSLLLITKGLRDVAELLFGTKD